CPAVSPTPLRPLIFPLLPYTTLFRSHDRPGAGRSAFLLPGCADRAAGQRRRPHQHHAGGGSPGDRRGDDEGGLAPGDGSDHPFPGTVRRIHLDRAAPGTGGALHPAPARRMTPVPKPRSTPSRPLLAVILTGVLLALTACSLPAPMLQQTDGSAAP